MMDAQAVYDAVKCPGCGASIDIHPDMVASQSGGCGWTARLLRGTKDFPRVLHTLQAVDVANDIRAQLQHIHDRHGICVKNIYGPLCPPPPDVPDEEDLDNAYIVGLKAAELALTAFEEPDGFDLEGYREWLRIQISQE